ncbi:MAG: hypothetical protein WD038_06560 [Balneolales bacterium]
MNLSFFTVFRLPAVPTYLFLLLFLILLLSCPTFAQTFFDAGGRNHPELDWVVSETEHFQIIYPSHLDGIQNQAAAIAEETYEVLSKNLDVALDKKVRIYLSDHDEIANGFAVPLANPYTNIWVHANEYAVLYTGDAKWLRKVISHELAHIFHFEAVRSGISPFEIVLANNPLPRFWTEGIAQYETELWDARRGDRWLRIAAFEDRLSYRDGQSIWNGNLMYAVGNSQVRFFAEKYGDSILADLLQHRKSTLFGLTKVHDFDAALQATIGKSYSQFYDDWQKHISIYYNTRAGQMDRLKSLDKKLIPLPATGYQDIKYSPDATQIAVLGLASLERPFTAIFTVSNDLDGGKRVIAKGPINPLISWHPSGDRIAYSRTTRGPGGAIVNDLYVTGFPSDNTTRLTRGRRARSPVYSPGGDRLAFIESRENTDNIVVMDLRSGKEKQATFFEGNVQLLSIQWHPTDDQILISRFSEQQKRDIILLDTENNVITPLTDGKFDDRFPVWNSDGSAIAYTSLRDQIENVFILTLDNPNNPVRVTNLFTGASVHDWLLPDSRYPKGRLVIQSTETKRADAAYLIDATERSTAIPEKVPSDYTTWTTHRPPSEIPKFVRPDVSLVQDHYPYHSFRNLTHVTSLATPYYAGTLLGEYEYGIAAGTGWIEPIGKHLLLAGGGISFTDVLDKSFFYISYTNNQFRPSLRFDLHKRKPSIGRIGRRRLLQEIDGGFVDITQPLDFFDAPYTTSDVQVRFRYTRRRIYNPDEFDAMPPSLAPPEAGKQADIRLTYTINKELPMRANVIQQSEGWGLRFRLTGALPGPFTDSSFFRPDLSAYAILPAPGSSRFYAYFRALGLYGDPFPQTFIGFTRQDYITVPFEDPLGLFSLPETERVRGYRDFLTGNQLLFGTLEYRVPFINLRTQVLGTALLGQTSISPFLDAGSLKLNENRNGYENRAGTGIELKNVLQVEGLRIMHSLGISQPVNNLGFNEDYDLYYRVRATVPF